MDLEILRALDQGGENIILLLLKSFYYRKFQSNTKVEKATTIINILPILFRLFPTNFLGGTLKQISHVLFYAESISVCIYNK